MWRSLASNTLSLLIVGGMTLTPRYEFTWSDDVFFEWTATQAGDAEISLCSLNTQAALSVYSGSGCSATCLMPSNAKGCGVSSLPTAVLDGVQPGDVFTIQVGHYISTGEPAVAFGDLVVGPAPTPIPNDDCSTPSLISGYGTTAWDTVTATASFFAPGPSAPRQPIHGP